jgi:hypothetical protein
MEVTFQRSRVLTTLASVRALTKKATMTPRAHLYYELLEKEVDGERWELLPTQRDMEDGSEGGSTKGDEEKEEGNGKGASHPSASDTSPAGPACDDGYSYTVEEVAKAIEC